MLLVFLRAFVVPGDHKKCSHSDSRQPEPSGHAALFLFPDEGSDLCRHFGRYRNAMYLLGVGCRLAQHFFLRLCFDDGIAVESGV